MKTFDMNGMKVGRLTEYGISPSLVSMIRRRKLWSEATTDLPDTPTRKTGPRKLQALTA